ncbi:solute symporter family protein [Selenihalanaerobacter shriftii]|uniref:Cation/acetate symporter n=1 Tax=Selenihalanaerobacter shriftii TaxID=142842 RepID=A0A1T4JQB4_9FIRM|nr:cation acetate symporter [Selenihalanaerobacter shriftii]SJZ32275.1 cation/acetate symporter [Selenihalanaerobacter shriftii]
MAEIPIIAVLLVIGLLAVVVGITIFSTRFTRTTSDFYVAGEEISVFQNASAISGDYLSAASFLGVAGAVFLNGFDGILYAYGFFLGYVLLLMFIAGQLKKFGEYTIPDFVEGRFHTKTGRLIAIVCVIMISLFYAAPQMLGVGNVLGLLLGIPYTAAVIGAGVVITLYVAFGGMKGTTLNQVIQFWVLFTAMGLLTVIAFGKGFSYSEILQTLSTRSGEITLPGGITQMFNGAEWTSPNGWLSFKDTMSLLIALCFGTAGLPHILVRFYTNPSGAKAKWTVIGVLILIGSFYIISPYVGTAMRYIMVEKSHLLKEYMANALAKNGKNLAVPISAFIFGGQTLLGITIAGAVAAVLSTVSGLLMSLTSALGHDLYTSLINPDASEEQQVKVAKGSTLIMGAIVTTLGVAVQGQQIAVLVGLAFALAASTFFPILALGIWWKRATTKGAIAGMLTGLLSSFILIFLKDAFPPILQFNNPAMLTMALAIVVNVGVSLVDGKIPADVNDFMELVHGPEEEAA